MSALDRDVGRWEHQMRHEIIEGMVGRGLAAAMYPACYRSPCEHLQIDCAFCHPAADHTERERGDSGPPDTRSGAQE